MVLGKFRTRNYLTTQVFTEKIRILLFLVTQWWTRSRQTVHGLLVPDLQLLMTRVWFIGSYVKGSTMIFMFCWPCILMQFWVMTNLMHSFLMYLFKPLHVSSSKCSSSGGPNCINNSTGITHSGEWLSASTAVTHQSVLYQMMY
jgi:hypothetical protein